MSDYFAFFRWAWAGLMRSEREATKLEKIVGIALMVQGVAWMVLGLALIVAGQLQA